MIGFPPHNPHAHPPGMMGYPMGPPHGGHGPPHGGPGGQNNMMEKKIDNWSFSLNNVLGQGSSGTVYKGKNDKTGNSVAIKCVDQRTLITDYAKELIRSEIDIMKQLDHPNIVKLHGFIRTMNNTYIIAEFCGGGDLRDFMQKMRRMNEKEALRIMSEIVAGVNELAKNGIIHRDLKPANILVQDGVFKLTDFGFAKQVDDFEEQMMVSLVGTPLYMSPQILKRQKYSSKCDVWSMGLILYEMLYGDTPWPAFNVIELVNSIHNKPLRFPPNIKVSDATKNFIRQCLQIEEDDRLSVEDLVSCPLFKQNKEKEAPLAPQPPSQQNLQPQQQQQQQQNIPSNQNVQQMAPGKPMNQNINPQTQMPSKDGVAPPNMKGPANFKPYEYKGAPVGAGGPGGPYKKAIPGSPKVGRNKDHVEEEPRRQTAYVKNTGATPLQQINPHNLPQTKPKTEAPPQMMKNPTAPNIANQMVPSNQNPNQREHQPSSQTNLAPPTSQPGVTPQPPQKTNNYMPVPPQTAPTAPTTDTEGHMVPPKRLTQPNSQPNVERVHYQPPPPPSTNQYGAPSNDYTHSNGTNTHGANNNNQLYVPLVPPQKLQHNVSFGDPSVPSKPTTGMPQAPSTYTNQIPTNPNPTTNTNVTTTNTQQQVSAPYIATPFTKPQGTTGVQQTYNAVNHAPTPTTTTTTTQGTTQGTAPAPPVFGAVDKYQTNMMNNYLSTEYVDNQRFIGSQLKLLKYLKYLRRKVEDPLKNLMELSPFLLEKTVFVILQYSQLISSKLKVGMVERGENVLFLNEWETFKTSENLKVMVEHIQKEYFEVSTSFYNLWKKLQENKQFVEDLKRDRDFSEIFVGEVTDQPSYFQRSISYVRWFVLEMNHRMKTKVAQQQATLPEGDTTGLFAPEDRKTLEVMDGMMHFLELLTKNLTEFKTFPVFCRDKAFEQLYFENNTPITDVALFKSIRKTIKTTLV